MISKYIIENDGTKVWRNEKGQLHRLDGPAVYRSNIVRWFYINNQNMTVEVVKWMRENDYTYPFNDEQVAEIKLRFL